MRTISKWVVGWVLASCLACGVSAYGYTEPEEADYFAVFLEGKKVGHAIQTRIIADGKVTSTEKVRLSINRVGVPVTLDMSETAIETGDGNPLGFESTQHFSMMMVVIKGQVRPNGTMEVVTQSMGAEQKTEPNWPAGAIMCEGLRLLSLQKGLAEGTQYKALVFVPSLMQAVMAEVVVGPKLEIDVLGSTEVLTEVKTTLSVPSVGRMSTTSYVDDLQRARKTLMPLAGMQFEMIHCTQAFALTSIDPVEFIDKMLVRSPVALENLAKVASITYLLRPKDPGTALVIPQADTQTVRKLEDGKIEVTVTPTEPKAGAAYPYRGNDPDVLAALRPNAYLQSEDNAIVQLARQAVGDANDAAEAAGRIEAFVAGYIHHKDLSVGYASAAEVAKNKQGDCTEHAVLCAALCRAVGIPAKVVTGLAYVPEFAGVRTCFGGHAWTAAYVGGGWIGLDAAFKGTGRGGYDAGHIALAIGDGEPGDFFGIATTLGRFTIQEATVNPQ